jgi:hypothetical protein
MMTLAWQFARNADWKNSAIYFNRVLNNNPSYAYAFLGLLCVDLKISKEDDLANIKDSNSIISNKFYKHAIADPTIKSNLDRYIKATDNKIAPRHLLWIAVITIILSILTYIIIPYTKINKETNVLPSNSVSLEQRKQLTNNNEQTHLSVTSVVPKEQSLSAEQQSTSPKSEIPSFESAKMSNSEIQDEVDRIRVIWEKDADAISNNTYNIIYVSSGITAYMDKGKVTRIAVEKGINDFDYLRIYEYENGNLIFAYIESLDSHRLYFKDGKLFRWRYTSNVIQEGEFIDHHYESNSKEYSQWQDFALNESETLYSMALD